TASLINIDFADLTAIMEGRGLAAIGVGVSDGMDRIEQATRMALDSQLLDIKDVSMAQGALIHVVGGDDITLEEVTRAGELVTRSLAKDVRIVWGARVDSEIKGKARVMIVLTGVESKFGAETKTEAEPVPEIKKRFLGVFLFLENLIIGTTFFSSSFVFECLILHHHHAVIMPELY